MQSERGKYTADHEDEDAKCAADGVDEDVLWAGFSVEAFVEIVRKGVRSRRGAPTSR